MATAQALAPTRLRNRERLVWIVITVLLLTAVLMLAFQYLRRSTVGREITRFTISLPEKAVLTPGSIALSPNGRLLAFAAASEGKSMLWVHPLDSLSPKALSGTEGANSPFWSPDSRFIGFFTQGKLKKIEASSGSPVVLCESDGGHGGTWSQDGVIVFAPAFSKVLYRVSASGGKATPVTTPDLSRHEFLHLWPQFLPDGQHFMYLALSQPAENGGINIGRLNSTETKRVLSVDSSVAYAPPGYLLFVREGTLLAQVFDAEHMENTGDVLPVAERVQYQRGILGSAFSVSASGTLAYATGTGQNSQLVWFDRGGRQLGMLGTPSEYMQAELSPGGKQVAVEMSDRQKYSDIWLFDLLRGIPTRLTFNPGFDTQPVWSHDGNRVIFWSNQGGITGLHQKASNGSGNGELLVKGDAPPCDWSADGRFIVYEYWAGEGSKTGTDLWILPMFGECKPFPFVQTQFEEVNAQFSPDVRWLAYASNESGESEVYIQPFPVSGAKSRISTNGGSNPRWRRDGKELFYLEGNTIMAVSVKLDGSFEAGVPKALFKTQWVVSRYRYAVTADGQRFLVITPVQESPASITVVLNWTAGLKR